VPLEKVQNRDINKESKPSIRDSMIRDSANPMIKPISEFTTDAATNEWEVIPKKKIY
jgi:hypothetical protein